MKHRSFNILIALAILGGCATPLPRPILPSVAPATQPTASLEIGGAEIRPMYRELLAIDLPNVMQLASAQSLDIQQARQRVEGAKGRYEASVEAIFPVIAPGLAWQHLEGVNQAVTGDLVSANFSNILPALTLQWIINPGRVYYDILASKRRVEASGQQEQNTELSTLRRAAIEYYDLVLTQAKVAVARKAAAEAEEALRLTNLRVKNGTGLAADQMRARAFLAGRRQDLLLSVNQFYQASLALSLTLHLDAVVTLVPAPTEINQVTLVRDDLAIEQLLGMAVQYRPDLQSARTLLTAAEADKGSVVWGALGPKLQAAYTFGGIATRAHGQDYSLHEQQRASAGANFALSPSVFGNTKAANSTIRAAALDVEQQLDQVRAQVVSAQQASLTHSALIPIAREQVDSAQEALRLAQSNLREGTLLLLDVLQAENELDVARLRYADAVARYNQSQVNLLAALGLLEAGKFTSIAGAEKPPSHDGTKTDTK
jgi:multidrug efflux system outer membrane protein